MIGLGVGIDYALFIVTRFRENRRAGDDVAAATIVSMDTAGRAVLFAGSTVIIALLGMVVLGLSFLDGLAVASALAVLLTMLASLTMLPALLAYVGKRVGRARAPAARPASAGTWARWARFVSRHPWPAALTGLAIMLVVAIPALSMDMGVSDAGNDPAGTHDAQGLRPARRGVRAGLQRSADGRRRASPTGRTRVQLDRIGAALRGTADVAAGRSPGCQPRRPDGGLPGDRAVGPAGECHDRPREGAARHRAPPGRAADRLDDPGRRRDRGRHRLHARAVRQAAAVHRRRRRCRSAAAAGRLPLVRDPDPGGVHEPALDRRRARRRPSPSSSTAGSGAWSASPRARSSRGCR